MYALDEYLTETESAAERAYFAAYRREYERNYDPKYAGDREKLIYWSALAHSAGKTARERVLAQEVNPS